jgi:hypothetical protein
MVLHDEQCVSSGVRTPLLTFKVEVTGVWRETDFWRAGAKNEQSGRLTPGSRGHVSMYRYDMGHQFVPGTVAPHDF